MDNTLELVWAPALAAALPVAIIYLLMFLGLVRRMVVRKVRGADVAGTNLLMAFDPAEMTLCALVLDLAGILRPTVVALRLSHAGTTSGSSSILGLTVALLLLIIHLQLYVHFIRSSAEVMSGGRREPYERPLSFSRALAMVAVLSNAMTVLTVIG